MLAEADALDRLLEQAPRASAADVDALKERIMAAALRSQRAAACRRCFGQAGFGQGRRPSPADGHRSLPRFTRSEWPAAAMLAASLVIGVMLGSTGTFDTTMQEMAEVAGLSATADNVNTDSSQLALGEDVRRAVRRGSAMTTETVPSPGTYRKLRYGLMASLALNVLIIGAVAGTLCF